MQILLKLFYDLLPVGCQLQPMTSRRRVNLQAMRLKRVSTGDAAGRCHRLKEYLLLAMTKKHGNSKCLT